MKLLATLASSVQANIRAEFREIERAVAVRTRDAGRGLKTELRRQVASAGLGSRLASSWRDKHYPNQRLDAASLVHTTAPQQAPRYRGGGDAGSGLLPDEVPIIAWRGELVVPPERVAREEKSAREQRPITVVVNVTAADASSFRASQGQIAADMTRAIDRASRNC